MRVQLARAPLVLAFLIALAVAPLAHAAGKPDPAFGDGAGKVVLDVGDRDQGQALAVQPDGKLLVGGGTTMGTGADPRFVIARYEANGRLDAGFASGGTFVGPDNRARGVVDLLLQLDGKIVFAGASVVERLNPDGTPDSSFGTNGATSTEPFVAGIGLQGDRLLVLAAGPGPGADFRLSRLLPDGGVDATFGSSGSVVIDFGRDEIQPQLEVAPDGSILVGGTSRNSTTTQAVLARFLPDGAPDATFGTGGRLVLPNGAVTVDDLLVQPDGKIVAAADGVLRLLPNGALDPSFRVRGNNWDTLALRPDGKIVAAFVGPQGFRVFRIRADGTDDTSFGSNGTFAMDLPFTTTSTTNGTEVAVAPDGGIVVVGTRFTEGFNSDLVLGRVIDVPVDTTPPAITPQVVGTLGDNGWYRSDVTVSFGVVDPDSAVSSTNGCGASAVTTDVRATTFTCTATSSRGTSSRSVVVKRDATPPSVAYAGAQATYALTDTVAISCSATDATSGTASSSCADLNGPAYSFPGANTLTAAASDNAGNHAEASVAFSVPVTAGGLCTLTKQFLEGWPSFQKLPPSSRAAIDAKATKLCSSIAAVQATVDPRLKAILIAVYQAGVQGLVPLGWLTSDQAAVLIALAARL